jgi:hypothetical protein
MWANQMKIRSWTLLCEGSQQGSSGPTRLPLVILRIYIAPQEQEDSYVGESDENTILDTRAMKGFSLRDPAFERAKQILEAGGPPQYLV